MNLKILFASLIVAVNVAEARAQVTMPMQCDNAKFLSDRQSFESGAPTGVDLPEHICGAVTSVNERARYTRSGLHSFFNVSVGQGVTIRIVSDLNEMNAPQWPWVRSGDQVEIAGRYYFDSARSQGIDWTHHGTGRHWSMPGYVIVNGAKYQ